MSEETELKRFTVGFSLMGSIEVEAKDADDAVTVASSTDLGPYIKDTVCDYVEEVEEVEQ